MRPSRRAPAVAVLLLSCLTLALAGDEGSSGCSEKVTVNLVDKTEATTDRDKPVTVYKFSVDILVEESGCHLVDYDLLLSVLDPDGAQAEDHRKGQVKLHDGQAMSEVIEYQVPLGGEVTDYSIVGHSCSGC